MKERFVVVGLGLFGSGVARCLHAEGQEVVAIDVDQALVDGIGGKVARAVCGDATQHSILEKAGVLGAKHAVVSTGDNPWASVMAVLGLKDLGVENIYVKVTSAEHIPVFEKLGVTEVIFPEREEALRVGHRIANRALLTYVRLPDQVAVQDMTVPVQWCGQSLRDLDLPGRFRIQIIAVRDTRSGRVDSPPHPDAVLVETDTLVVGGPVEALERVAALR